MCEVSGCTTPVHGRGLCAKHYGRWYRTGTTELIKGADCSLCGKPAVGLLLCRYHYNRWVEYGTPDKGSATPRVQERHSFPTRPWLPTEGGEILHVQSWVLLANGFRRFVAACNLRKPLVHVNVDKATPCGACVYLMKRHGLIA